MVDSGEQLKPQSSESHLRVLDEASLLAVHTWLKDVLQNVVKVLDEEVDTRPDHLRAPMGEVVDYSQRTAVLLGQTEILDRLIRETSKI